MRRRPEEGRTRGKFYVVGHAGRPRPRDVVRAGGRAATASRRAPEPARPRGKRRGGNRCICMSCTHPRTHTHTPPGSRSRYQKYCRRFRRRAAAGSGAERRRPRAGRQPNRRCGGSGCLWQTPFLHAASSLSLSPPFHRSRRFRSALARWLLLYPMWPHCTAPPPLPSRLPVSVPRSLIRSLPASALKR